MKIDKDFQRFKEMMLEICNDPRKLCVWENKKFDLDKYLIKSKAGQEDFIDGNIVEIINSIMKLAQDQNVPLRITADFSLTR